MAYKILTKNGIDNTNIDGARGEYFNSGMRDGIVQGVLNEGLFTATASNIISLDTCELRIAGHRIVIDEPVYHTFTNAPNNDTRYAFVAQVVIDDNQNVDFSLFVQTANTPLIQNDLYKNITGAGTYQVEIGRFTVTKSLIIEDVVKTLDVITGGTGVESGDYITIGEVSTTTTASGTQANVDIENVERQGKMQTDFHFDIPTPIGTTIVVDDEEQESISFTSDPQTQINQLSNPNLLINGDFKVNQRGFTSVETTSTNNSGIVYTVDRWIFASSLTRQGKLEVNSNGGLDFSCYSTAISLQQILESSDTEKLKGRTVTATIKVSAITGNSPLQLWIRDKVSWGNYGQINISSAGTYSVSGNIPSNITGNVVVYISYDNFQGQTTASIDWVKLEVGSQSTDFSPRPYAEELAMCQRYFINIPADLTGYSGYTANNGDYAIITVPLPAPMRTMPTITVNNLGYLRLNGQIVPPTQILVDSIQNNCLVLRCNATLPAYYTICLMQAGFELDAEVY